MKKSLTGLWGLRDFVRSIRLRRSLPAEAGKKAVEREGADLLKEFLALIRERQHDEEATPDMVAKAKLAAIVLPEVFLPNGTLDHAAAKKWAFALGDLVGFLAGVSVQQPSMHGAIDEIARVAKILADSTHEMLEEMITRAGGPLGGRAAPTTPILGEQQLQMIKDLEEQATAETDPAAKAALRLMAQQMKDGRRGETV